MNFRTQYNFELGESQTDLTLITEPSATIPDQSLSIRELYERYSRGLPLSEVDRHGFYDDSEDPDPDSYDHRYDPDYDLSDLDNDRIENHNKITRLNNSLTDLKKRKHETTIKRPSEEGQETGNSDNE